MKNNREARRAHAGLRGTLALACAACGGPTVETRYAPIDFPAQPDAGAASEAPLEPRPAPAASALAAVPAEDRAAPASSSVSGDPWRGKPFTLADATDGLAGAGALVATIKTSHGDLRCKLLDGKAPIAVAHFVGLARGTRPWKAAGEGWVKRPAYDGTTFHRIIKGFMIQGGDPEGTGRGEPGFAFQDEVWPGARHDRAGLLCMANRGPNTNGMQFFITDAGAKHLDTSYTIFGECSPVSIVHAIASVRTGIGDRPHADVTISTVEIARGNP